MPIQIIRGESDEAIERVIGALDRYVIVHPKAQIDLYRAGPFSIRIRIIDPDFAGRGRKERHQQTWSHLKILGEEDLGDVSSLTLITPDEKGKSFANFVYEDPEPLDY